MVRKAIPLRAAQSVLYEAAYVCTICQSAGVQLHHIDEDHSNNAENNLVCLCAKHHDEAHTRKKNSRNLDPAALLHAKNRWVNTVAARRLDCATSRGSVHSETGVQSALWGYINHTKVVQLKRLPGDHERLHFKCMLEGLVDENGIIQSNGFDQVSEEYIANTVYHLFSRSGAQLLHRFYEEMVDAIVRHRNPVFIEDHWLTKFRVESAVSAGSFIFINRAFYFKEISTKRGNQLRRVHTKKGKVRIEFYIETVDMFGSSSIEISFRRHQTCAAVLLVKSLNIDKEGVLTLACTPVALGVAFVPHSPFPIL